MRPTLSHTDTQSQNNIGNFLSDNISKFVTNIFNITSKFLPLANLTNSSTSAPENKQIEENVQIMTAAATSQKVVLDALSSKNPDENTINHEFRNLMVPLFVAADNITDTLNNLGSSEQTPSELKNFAADINKITTELVDERTQLNERAHISGSPTLLKPIIPKANSNGKTILVAEDNELNQVVLKSILVNHNFEIANNGQEAVELFKANPDKYSMILMDLRMPKKDGIQATKEIRAHEINTGNTAQTPIPIIALTANTEQTDQDNAKQAGMNFFCFKPYRKNSILELINQCMPNEISNKENRAAEIATVPDSTEKKNCLPSSYAPVVAVLAQ